MIIGISGKKGAGKDEVGKIIQWLSLPEHNGSDYNRFKKTPSKNWDTSWEIKKYADKLKDIVCILIGCTRGQLEDRNFKEKELGAEWWIYKHISKQDSKIITKREYDNLVQTGLSACYNPWQVVKPTPRLLLQLIGTECFRDIIHPDTWVNALFSDYRTAILPDETTFLPDDWVRRNSSNWIVTDVRMPNEKKAIEDKGGIVIRVERDIVGNDRVPDEHYSEIALDDAEFDLP